MKWNPKKQRRLQSPDPDEQFAVDMRVAQDREVARRVALHASEGEPASLATLHAVFEVAVSSVICALGLMKLYGAREEDSRLMMREAQDIFDEVHPMVTKLEMSDQTQERGKS